MKNPVEEILAPVRQKAAEANAPLLAKLGLTPKELERVMGRLPLTFIDASLLRAAAMAALRGATRF
jgi:hypothetical protein